MADAGEKVPIQETGVAAATAGEPSPLEKPAPPPASHQKKTGCVVYQHLWVSHSIYSENIYHVLYIWYTVMHIYC